VPFRAKVYICAQLGLSLGVLLWVATRWQCEDPWTLLAYFALGLAGSLVKVRLPGIEGTMSVSFLVIILAFRWRSASAAPATRSR
jgi:hypothetical protein